MITGRRTRLMRRHGTNIVKENYRNRKRGGGEEIVYRNRTSEKK